MGDLAAPAREGTLPTVDLIDETFIVAAPDAVAGRLHDPRLWARWWPELDLTVFQDRAAAGLRWTVTGALVGTSEVWLEPWRDGVLVHYYLRADPTARGSDTAPLTGRPGWVRRRTRRARQRHAMRLKRSLFELKDEMEAGREVGLPRRGGEAGAPDPPGGGGDGG